MALLGLKLCRRVSYLNIGPLNATGTRATVDVFHIQEISPRHSMTPIFTPVDEELDVVPFPVFVRCKLAWKW
jgi:hypothetical protein